MLQPFRRGEPVEVFYRMGCDDGGYFPVATQSAGTLRPRFGKSDGWMPGRIEEDWPPAHPQGGHQHKPPRVRVRHTHPHWSNRRGERLDPLEDRDMVVFLNPADVRRPVGAEYTPALSVLSVRWGAEQTPFNNEQWGAASSSVSDTYAEHLLDGVLYQRLGPNYEVVTAFVESGADLRRLLPQAIAPMMTGRHMCALYFLWPVMAQDGDVEQSGMVSQADYFAAVRGFEAAGVPTRFPHSSQLYETLLAKDWQASLCMFPKLRVPVATTINRAAVVRSPRRAAACVIEALAAAREVKFSDGSEPESSKPLEGEVRRGVVKLGFAWEAAHVRVFRGESQLAEAMSGLIATPGVEAASLTVQDYVKNHLELRCFVVNGRVEHIIYSSFERVDVDGYPRDFVKKERGDAIADWLSGDAVAMEDAERKAGRLVRQWLAWLRCKSSEPTPAIRMDILVSRTGPGRADVHTLELTENGFSMLAWPAGPSTVFNALVESFFSDVEQTAADVSLLTSTRPAGSKGRELLGGTAAHEGGGGSSSSKKAKKKHKRAKDGGAGSERSSGSGSANDRSGAVGSGMWGSSGDGGGGGGGGGSQHPAPNGHASRASSS
jgi:hypothetical protein